MSSVVQPPANDLPSARARGFYFAVWRWHFYTGLFVIPFLIMLSITGLIILWVTAIAPEYGDRLPVAAAGQAMTETALAEKVNAIYPDATITKFVLPYDAQTPALFQITASDVSRMLAVDPYTGTVLQDRESAGTWNEFATDIHGKLLIGPNGGFGDTVIEIAAGFGIVLIITGLYLWWPRNGASLRKAVTIDFSLAGRPFWKAAHSATGFWLAIVLAFFLVSGLAWTSVWGGKLVQAWSTFPAEKWDNVPLSDKTHESMNHGSLKEVPWALEQTPMPESGSTAGIAGLPEGMPVTLQSVVSLGRAIGFEGRFQIAYPADETGVWTLSQDSMSYDSSNPFADRTVHVDQYTGKILADVKFADYSPGGKAMAAGIALHEGQLGWWNIALNIVYCAGVLFLCVSGIVMWWIRRPKGAFRLAAPAVPENIMLWKGAALTMLLVSLAFPLTGLSLLGLLAIDLLIFSRVRAIREALN